MKQSITAHGTSASDFNQIFAVLLKNNDYNNKNSVNAVLALGSH